MSVKIARAVATIIFMGVVVAVLAGLGGRRAPVPAAANSAQVCANLNQTLAADRQTNNSVDRVEGAVQEAGVDTTEAHAANLAAVAANAKAQASLNAVCQP